MGCFFVTTVGWFAWLSFLDGVFAASPSGPYAIRDTFTYTFGRDATWWGTLFLVLGFLGIMDISVYLVKRNLRVAGLLRWDLWRKREEVPAEHLDLEIWQELEQDPVMFAKLKRMARDEDFDEEDVIEPEDGSMIDVGIAQKASWKRKLRNMIPGKETA